MTLPQSQMWRKCLLPSRAAGPQVFCMHIPLLHASGAPCNTFRIQAGVAPAAWTSLGFRADKMLLHPSCSFQGKCLGLIGPIVSFQCRGEALGPRTLSMELGTVPHE